MYEDTPKKQQVEKNEDFLANDFKINSTGILIADVIAKLQIFDCQQYCIFSTKKKQKTQKTHQADPSIAHCVFLESCTLKAIFSWLRLTSPANVPKF